jgi:ribose transport system substrate-binding protein
MAKTESPCGRRICTPLERLLKKILAESIRVAILRSVPEYRYPTTLFPVPLILMHHPIPPSSFCQVLRPSAVLGLSLALFGSFVQPAHAEKQLRIGVAMKTLNAPYFAAQGKAAEEEAKKLGATAISADSQNDMMKQIADVEDLLAKGIDGLILNPKDAKGLVPVTKECAKAGVPVVIIDSSIDPAADYVTTVQSNNTANGMKVGEWFASAFGDKTPRIALLSGEQGNVVGEDRRDAVFRGITEAQLRQYGKASYVVVGQGWGGWTTEGGLKAMEDLLTAHKDIDVVLGENDSMVLGAIKAIQEAGKQPMKDIFVFAAADGQKEALQAIKAGTYGATGLNNPKLVASTGVDILVKAIKKELPANFPKVSYTEPAAITKDNVDKFIDPNAVF